MIGFIEGQVLFSDGHEVIMQTSSGVDDLKFAEGGYVSQMNSLGF